MSETRSIDWVGQSGRSYSYQILPIGTDFRDAPGNYVFARESSPRNWQPIYIGQTGSLARRLSHHEKESCARGRGATHIHAHLSGDEYAREDEERDLIVKWRPPCNQQLT
ncbi:MAG: hypothetical protein RLZZ126_584 [Pseudomonadota bacterium]|jgi:hypothetical protein